MPKITSVSREIREKPMSHSEFYYKWYLSLYREASRTHTKRELASLVIRDLHFCKTPDAKEAIFQAFKLVFER